MKRFEFILDNEHGLHARPAGMLVQLCGKYQSAVSLFKAEQKVNAKSLLGVMKIAASKGDALAIEVGGDDEIEALESIKALIERNFDE